MKSILIVLTLAVLVLSSSCSKEDSVAGYLEPIAVRSPTTNPAKYKLNQQFNLEATFTTENLIDSVMITYQLDSNNVGYNSALASHYITVKYPTPAKNIQEMNIPFITNITSTVVKKIYINFKLIAGSKTFNKQLSVEII